MGLRENDFRLTPLQANWTVESLLPRGFCPNTPQDIDEIRNVASNWNTDLNLQEWRQNRLEMIRRRLPDCDPKTIIDYGSYFGETATILKDRYPNATVIAMDKHINYSVVAKEYDSRLETAVTDPGRLLYDKDSVDIIMMADVAEHLYEDEWLQVLSDSFDVLKMGGYILNHCPVCNGWINKTISEVVNTLMIELRHPAVKSIEYIKSTMANSGYKNLQGCLCIENNEWGWAGGTK